MPRKSGITKFGDFGALLIDFPWKPDRNSKYSKLGGGGPELAVVQVIRICIGIAAEPHDTIPLIMGLQEGGVKNRNKRGCKRLLAFVHVCSRLLAFFPSAFACVCQRLSVCSHLLTSPFCRAPSA